jgi:hypothetical protein
LALIKITERKKYSSAAKDYSPWSQHAAQNHRSVVCRGLGGTAELMRIAGAIGLEHERHNWQDPRLMG